MVELEFLCDYCGRPVADGEGCLLVFFADLSAYRSADADWKQIHGDGPSTPAQILDRPVSVPWHVHHDACNPRREDGYDIDVRKVRTWRALLLETSRLMSKNWLALTDWPRVIGAAADGSSGRIVELARGDAA